MKKPFSIVLFIVFSLGLCGVALPATRTTVTKDSTGTMSKVTAFSTDGTAKSGQTFFQVTPDTGISIYANEINNPSLTADSSGVTLRGGVSLYATNLDTPTFNSDSSGVTFSGGVSIYATTMNTPTMNSDSSGVTFSGGVSLYATNLDTPTLNSDSTGTTVDSLVSIVSIAGGVSPFFEYSGITLTAAHLRGGMIYSHATSAIVLGIPTIGIGGSTGYFMVKDMTGSGVTIQTTDGQTFYKEDEAGTAIFLNAGNSRDQAGVNLLYESGTCVYADVFGTIGGSNWNVE